MKNKIHQVLSNHFPYYQDLSTQKKSKFRYRTEKFIKDKKFLPRPGVYFTDEVKILTVAPAIQLTMGHKEYLFSHFHTIILFPGAYRSPYTKTTHLGETNTSGIVVFSWPDLKRGIEEADGYNLGIHEYAHAMHLSIIMEKSPDPFFAEYFDKWQSFAEVELRRLAKGEAGIFRKFSGKNIHETFAVCAEHFFEKPSDFKQDAPELYFHTCRLFLQDPLARNMVFQKNRTYSTRKKDTSVVKATINAGSRSMASQVKIMFGSFIAFGMFSIIIESGTWGFFVPMAGIFFLQLLTSRKTIQLFNNCIIIKPRYKWQKTQEKIIFLEDVINAGISINTSEEGVHFFQLFVYHDGQIEKVFVSTDPSNSNILKNYLLKNHIISRTDGFRIYPKKKKRKFMSTSPLPKMKV